MKEKPYKKFFKEDRRNMLPKSFPSWLDENFGGDIENFASSYDINISEQYDYAASDIKRYKYQNDEAYERAVERSYAEEMKHEQYRIYLNWLNYYKSMEFPITLYRVIRLNAKSLRGIQSEYILKDFQKGIGVYWTDGEGELESYAGRGKGSDFTIRAEVNEASINWENTLKNNMSPSLGEMEREIQLELGTKIKLTGIAQGKTVRDTDFEPLNVMVRA